MIENWYFASKEDLVHSKERLPFDSRAQDAIDLNLLEICEKKEWAEARLWELEVILTEKTKRIRSLEISVYEAQ